MPGTGARPTLQPLPDDLRPAFTAEVKRRLRAQAAQRLTDLQDGELVVLRALPGCGDASSGELGRFFDAGLAQARRRTERKVAQR